MAGLWAVICESKPPFKKGQDVTLRAYRAEEVQDRPVAARPFLMTPMIGEVVVGQDLPYIRFGSKNPQTAWFSPFRFAPDAEEWELACLVKIDD